MFYSHTFLARKGPLGTVWCAAHLQHRLKKSHYASTDIPSTVERIIFPEVPIALRMSGHLLLGVVRIYSKKVDYLHHDCNDLWVSLRNAFRHIDVNLPENATHAQFNAVTLPETYALDAVDVDVDFSLVDGSQDGHFRSQEEITLKEQYHAEQELYVRITFDDDIMTDPLQSQQWDGGEPMQTDILYDTPADQNAGLNQEGESIPPYEVMRDRDTEFHPASPVLQPNTENVDLNLSTSHSTPKDMTQKETDTLLHMHTPTPADSHQPLQDLQHGGPSSPPTEAHVASDIFENVSPTELELRPSPPPEKPQPQQRKRKRKQYFDESLVLNNEQYKKGLNDCSDLVKKKKKLPCSALELWRFNVMKKKIEDVFSEPLISGMCTNLEHLYREDVISSNANLLVREEAQPRAHASDDIEVCRSADVDPGHNLEQLLPSSPPLFSQPKEAEGFSSPGRIPSPVSEPQFETTGSVMGMETPSLNSGEAGDDFGTVLSDVPESRNYMESDQGLNFLEQDDNSPTDSQGARTADTMSHSQGPRTVDSMSARTRAVAEYLKNHTPLSKVSEGSDMLNLSTILEGKRRKLCARMFYETLVLKDYGLIDVQQDEPYGDIILKLTHDFSTTKILGGSR